MLKKIIGIILALILLVGIFAVVLSANKEDVNISTDPIEPTETIVEITEPPKVNPLQPEESIATEPSEETTSPTEPIEEVEDETLPNVETQPQETIPEESENSTIETTQPTEPIETEPIEETQPTEPDIEETTPIQETEPVEEPTEPPVEDTTEPIEPSEPVEDTTPPIEEPDNVLIEDVPYEQKFKFENYNYEYEIPLSHKSDVIMIVNAIDRAYNDVEQVILWNKDFDYIFELEDYLRLYYTDGFDLDHPDKWCSCLFIHSYYIDYDEYGNKMYVIDLDIPHCKEVIKECCDWKMECLAIRGYMPIIMEELDLNGYVIHDLMEVQKWICANAQYDWEALENDLSGNCQDITGLIYDGKIVCGGYANTYKRICNYIGLDVQYVSGLGNSEGHAWNSIELNDTTYYIDCTWDDTELEGMNGPIICNWDYFLKTREYFEAHGHVFQD